MPHSVRCFVRVSETRERLVGLCGWSISGSGWEMDEVVYLCICDVSRARCVRVFV